MKRAVLLHGTDGSPQGNWFPWLKGQLETHGYEVWAPELPNNHTPDRVVYNDFLFSSDWDFSNNLIVGHSSGAVSVLNLLADVRCPVITTAIMVGAWSHMEETDLDREQFKDLFSPDGFDFKAIKEKAPQRLFVHGSDDPLCPLEQAKWLAEQTDSEIVIVPDGGHLSSKFKELPELIEALIDRNWL